MKSPILIFSKAFFIPILLGISVLGMSCKQNESSALIVSEEREVFYFDLESFLEKQLDQLRSTSVIKVEQYINNELIPEADTSVISELVSYVLNYDINKIAYAMSYATDTSLLKLNEANQSIKKVHFSLIEGESGKVKDMYLWFKADSKVPSAIYIFAYNRNNLFQSRQHIRIKLENELIKDIRIDFKQNILTFSQFGYSNKISILKKSQSANSR